MKDLIYFDEDSKPTLNIKTFKEQLELFPWTKKIRKLGNQEQVFYIATLNTDTKTIHISIRPTLRMQLSESFKNRDTEGRAIKEGSRPREVVSFGSTVEVLVDSTLINKIESIAKDIELKKPVVVSWS